MNELSKMITDALTPKYVLDAAAAKKASCDSDNDEDDGVKMDSAKKYVVQNLALKSANSILSWSDMSEDDLSAGETMADRLQSLLIGIVDSDMNGKLSKEESYLFDMVREYAGQYLSRLGADDSDINLLLNDSDDDAADSIISIIQNADDDTKDVNDFALSNDDVALDSWKVASGTYKKVKAVRNGEVTYVNKRITGKVTLSAAQRTHINELASKPKKALSVTNWMRSMQVRKKSGIGSK